MLRASEHWSWVTAMWRHLLARLSHEWYIRSTQKWCVGLMTQCFKPLVRTVLSHRRAPSLLGKNRGSYVNYKYCSSKRNWHAEVVLAAKIEVWLLWWKNYSCALTFLIVMLSVDVFAPWIVSVLLVVVVNIIGAQQNHVCVYVRPRVHHARVLGQRIFYSPIIINAVPVFLLVAVSLTSWQYRVSVHWRLR